MTEYSTFTVAYKPENLNKEPRVSMDVPMDLEEWKTIVNTTSIIVLYLWSEGCRPCLLIRDKYENLASEYASPYIRFYKDNIDKPSSFHRNSVEVVPTFIILVNGKEVDHHPKYKSRYSGWTEEMKEAILFYMQQCQEQTKMPPRFVCKNNVCYIQNDV